MAIFWAVLCGFFFYAWLNEFHFNNYSNCLIIASVISLLGFLIFQFFGLYKKQLSLMNLIEIKKIIQGVSILFLSIVIVYVLIIHHYPSILFVYSALFVLTFVLTERMMIFKLQQSLHNKGINITRIMVMGVGDEALLIYHYILQAPKYGYKIVGFFSPVNPEKLKRIKSKFNGHDLLFLSDLKDFKDKIEACRINELWICSPDFVLKTDGVSKIQQVCQRNDIALRFAPFLSGYYPGKLKYTDIGGIPMISFEAASQNPLDLVLKRLFDLVAAFILVVLLSPLLLLLTILIRKNSNGSVIFKQERVGKDGVLFTMYKFRTMYPDSPHYENSPSSSDDSRITRLGKILRRTSLDELPQLFNVLKGNMSLVGPRPEMPFIVENEYDDFFRQRLQVKPGITGVWQVSGDRSKEIHENISYDIFYIANRSLLLDLIILARTLLFALMAMKTH